MGSCYLFWDLYGKEAALHGPWKLVGEIASHRGDFDRAAADAAKAGFELYNLESDPAEEHDLTGNQPEIYADLKGRHVEWLRAAAR